MHQTTNMTCQEYFEKVRNVVKVIKSLGGSLDDPMRLKEELPSRQNVTYTDQQTLDAKKGFLTKQWPMGY